MAPCQNRGASSDEISNFQTLKTYCTINAIVFKTSLERAA
jgi:hypothetical protein